jgi:hypothetical protein
MKGTFSQMLTMRNAKLFFVLTMAYGLSACSSAPSDSDLKEALSHRPIYAPRNAEFTKFESTCQAATKTPGYVCIVRYSYTSNGRQNPSEEREILVIKLGGHWEAHEPGGD